MNFLALTHMCPWFETPLDRDAKLLGKLLSIWKDATEWYIIWGLLQVLDMVQIQGFTGVTGTEYMREQKVHLAHYPAQRAGSYNEFI